ncbi:hypothetical protein AWC38_SpisGene10168 [Stylophora pistillata]|uniref:SAP domain-containing protein n=1 Tax=Stylophora pistillata TaxID=50429 RepID=A0A2B4S9K9_STYPI|nr:hypothetical protein AWC38_SpisGene10168 [Stylophora pistillata]
MVSQLKRWLKCRGLKLSGKRTDLIASVCNCLKSGNFFVLDSSTDDGKWLEAKILGEKKVNQRHYNDLAAPVIPKTGWRAFPSQDIPSLFKCGHVCHYALESLPFVEDNTADEEDNEILNTGLGHVTDKPFSMGRKALSKMATFASHLRSSAECSEGCELLLSDEEDQVILEQDLDDHFNGNDIVSFTSDEFPNDTPSTPSNLDKSATNVVNSVAGQYEQIEKCDVSLHQITFKKWLVIKQIPRAAFLHDSTTVGSKGGAVVIELSKGKGVYLFEGSLATVQSKLSPTSAACFLLSCFYNNQELGRKNLTGANAREAIDPDILSSIVASEKKNFRLYYAVPLLMKYLPDMHVLHLMLIVGGIYGLLNETISLQERESSASCLKLFCAQASTLHGSQFMTYNVHQLLHLRDCVEDLGPLWSHSCFFFEDLNGDFRDLFHGTQNIDGQILDGVSVMQKLPELASELSSFEAQKLQNKKTTAELQALIDVAEEFNKRVISATSKASEIYRKNKVSLLGGKEATYFCPIYTYKKLSQQLNIIQIYIDQKAFIIVEGKATDISKVVDTINNELRKVRDGAFNDVVHSKLKDQLNDPIQYMDSKRDREILKAVIPKITSVKNVVSMKENTSTTRTSCLRNTLKPRLPLHLEKNKQRDSEKALFIFKAILVEEEKTSQQNVGEPEKNSNVKSNGGKHKIQTKIETPSSNINTGPERKRRRLVKFLEQEEVDGRVYFETGKQVEVLWTEKDLEGTAWEPGWYKGEKAEESRLEYEFEDAIAQEEGSARSCPAKFVSGSDKYEEAWIALQERFGHVDTVVSAGKKHIDQFPTIVKENSMQIRQYQEIVSEFIGIFKEHDFLQELNSQVPEATVAKLPARLCCRWAKFVEGNPKLSTWNSFANWLEKEAKISESKQRWMPEKREWKHLDTSKVHRRRSADKSQSGLFVGATGEALRTSHRAKRCPIHQSTNHTFQECKRFKGMLPNEKVRVVEEHRLCLCCLIPGHHLSKCRSRNRCKVENCDMRHHTLVHEVDLKFIERAKAKRESEQVPDVERDPAQVSLEGEDSSPCQAVEPHEGYHQSAYAGCEAGGRALVEVYERSSVEDEELRQLLVVQSEIETLGVMKLADPTRSIEDKRALSLMEKTTYKNANEDAYESGLLWMEEEPSLSNNYEMAKKRLQSLEKKIESCPEVRERYAKSIQDDIEKGYVKKLSEEEVQCDSKVIWYLPPRFVINPKKPDRLRRVYDASAKFMGQSLNDKIYTGPDLLSSLFGVFLRFREGRIALAADVKEMYHMLCLPDHDKPAMRFSWRYSLREEQILVKRLLKCGSRGGFHLHKWLTNDPDVLATIPEQDRSPRFLKLSEDKLPTDRTLGIIWDAQEDMLRFTGLKGDPGNTMRKILSQAFSVWDPRGLLPFSIRSKIILQNLNRVKYGWDDELKEVDLREWREWHREAVGNAIFLYSQLNTTIYMEDKILLFAHGLKGAVANSHKVVTRSSATLPSQEVLTVNVRD